MPKPGQGWGDGVEEGLQGGRGRLLTSSPQPLVPSEIHGSHLRPLMILTGSIRAPSGPLCLPDQWPLSWAHPSVTRSSSCSQPLEQPRPSPLQIGSQQPLRDPFSAIVSGQMALPLHTAPQAQPRLPAASGKGRESPRSSSGKPCSLSKPDNLARLGQQTVPTAQFWPRHPVSFLLSLVRSGLQEVRGLKLLLLLLSQPLKPEKPQCALVD